MSLGSGWRVHELPRVPARDGIAELLKESVHRSRLLLGSLGSGWTLVLTNGPLGTDLGVLPSRAARDLKVQALRATAVQPGLDHFPAAILEVFDPSSADPQLCARNVYAANDGGRWTFGEYGVRLPFEDVARYEARSVRDRLTAAMIRKYVAAFDVGSTGDVRFVHLVENGDLVDE